MSLLDKSQLKKALRFMNRSYRVPRGMNMYIPGRNEEIRREYVRRRKWAKEEGKIPFSIIIEILYMLFLLICGCVAILYFCLSMTLLGWTPSIQSITVNVSVKSESGGEYFYDMLERRGYFSRLWCIYFLLIGSYTFCVSIFPIWYAGFIGEKKWYYAVLVNHAIILIMEILGLLNAYSKIPSSCNTQLFRDSLTDYLKWYGILAIDEKNKGLEAMDKINALQAALGCCGIDGWSDYGSIFKKQGDDGFDSNWYPSQIFVSDDYEKKDLDYYLENGRDITQIPHSCCKPIWRHNIYCADDLIEIEKSCTTTPSLASIRLNSVGCVKSVEAQCESMLLILSTVFFYLALTHSISLIIVSFLTFMMRRSVTFLTQTLFLLTEGRAGKRYARMAQSPKDLNMNVVRHTNDRFDPKEFRWANPEETVKEVPKERRLPVPISTLLTVAETRGPGYHEQKQTQDKMAKQTREDLYFGKQYEDELTDQELYDATDLAPSGGEKSNEKIREKSKNVERKKNKSDIDTKLRGKRILRSHTHVWTKGDEINKPAEGDEKTTIGEAPEKGIKAEKEVNERKEGGDDKIDKIEKEDKNDKNEKEDKIDKSDDKKRGRKLSEVTMMIQNEVKVENEEKWEAVGGEEPNTRKKRRKKRKKYVDKLNKQSTPPPAEGDEKDEKSMKKEGGSYKWNTAVLPEVLQNEGKKPQKFREEKPQNLEQEETEREEPQKKKSSLKTEKNPKKEPLTVKYEPEKSVRREKVDTFEKSKNNEGPKRESFEKDKIIEPNVAKRKENNEAAKSVKNNLKERDKDDNLERDRNELQQNEYGPPSIREKIEKSKETKDPIYKNEAERGRAPHQFFAPEKGEKIDRPDETPEEDDRKRTSLPRDKKGKKVKVKEEAEEPYQDETTPRKKLVTKGIDVQKSFYPPVSKEQEDGTQTSFYGIDYSVPIEKLPKNNDEKKEKKRESSGGKKDSKDEERKPWKYYRYDSDSK